MLDPASALGLAAALVQLTGFVKGILSDSHEIYRSTDGALVRNIELESVCRRFDELMLITETRSRATQADDQLARLSNDTRKITKELLERLGKLKLDAGDSKWKTVRRAIESVMQSKDVKDLEARLDKQREQIGTALLLSQSEWVQKIAASQSSQSLRMEDMLKILSKELRVHGGLLKQLQLKADPSGIVDASSDDLKSFCSALLSAEVGQDEQKRMKFNAARIVEMLHYDDMPDRHDKIPKAYEATFNWIFEGVSAPLAGTAETQTDGRHPAALDTDLPQQSNKNEMWQCFPGWMKGDKALYWITGKPGAGKSTLMKFLYHDPRAKRAAMEWVNRIESIQTDTRPVQLRIASFFFWIAGSKMQKSNEGLLRTLLYQLLQENPELALQAFPQRSHRFKLFGADERDFGFFELSKALDCVLTQPNYAYLLFVDGLDEFEGEHSELVALMHQLAAKPRVKICLSSRPWTIFEDAFEDTSLIRIEHLTRVDILKYITGRFKASKRFLQLEKLKPKDSVELLSAIADKASGVFLWVYLAVGSLLNGLIDGDSISTLHQRLEDIPAELEEFFERILNEVDQLNISEASRIFQFFRSYPQDSTLIQVYFFDTPWEQAIQYDIDPCEEENLQYYAETMRRRLYSRCKCFLEVDNPSTPLSKIRYIHRTARDYIEQPRIWNRLVKNHPHYNPHRAVSISRLMFAKSIDPTISCYRKPLYLTLFSIVESSAIGKIEPITDRLALVRCTDYIGRQHHRRIKKRSPTSLHAIRSWLEEAENVIGRSPPPWPDTTFKLALMANLDWYVSAELKEDPSLLDQRINKQYPLIFATRKEFLSIQRILLDNGADPNRHEGGNSAWEIFVYQIHNFKLQPESSVNSYLDRIFDTLIKFLDCGADPEAIYGANGSTNVRARVVLAWLCEQETGEPECPRTMKLRSAFTEALKQRKSQKRKRLQLPWHKLTD